MIVRELITRLGFRADTSKVRRFDAAVRGLTTALVAGAAAAGAMSVAAFRLAQETARYGDELSKTADKLGINIDALEQMRFAAERSGVSQQTLEMAMQRMTRRLSEAAQGSGEAQGAIEELGLSAQELAAMTPDVAMERIADALAGVENQSDRVRLAFKFFDSEGVSLIQMLGEGSEEVRALREEFERLSGGLTEEQARAAEVFRDRLTDVRVAMQGLRLQIGARLLPVMQPMVEGFTDFLVANREIITQGIARAFELISNAVMNLSAVVVELYSAFEPLVQAFMDLDPAIQLALGALLLFLMPMGKLRSILIGAGLVAALEDLGAWMRGQPSLIENLLGPYEEFAQKLGRVVDLLGGMEVIVGGLLALRFGPWLWAAARGMIAFLAASGPIGWVILAIGAVAAGALWIRDNWDTVAEAMQPIIDRITAGFERVKDAVNAVIERIRAVISVARQAAEAVGDFFDSNRSGGSTEVHPDRPQVGPGGAYLYENSFSVPAPRGPTADQAAGAPSVQNTNIVEARADMNITVPPGSTAEQIAFIRAEARRALEGAVSQAALSLEA